MRRTLITLLALSALALPASAQLVNGLPGPDYRHDTPIGTKGGGAPSTLQAPGEAAAIAGAIRNEMDARNMGPLARPVSHTVAMSKPVQPKQTVARNEWKDWPDC